MPNSKKNKTIVLLQDDNKTWGKFGSVYSYKKKHYVKLGSL